MGKVFKRLIFLIVYTLFGILFGLSIAYSVLVHSLYSVIVFILLGKYPDIFYVTDKVEELHKLCNKKFFKDIIN